MSSKTVFLSDFVEVRNDLAQVVGSAHAQWLADLERMPLKLINSGDRYSVMPVDPMVGAAAGGRSPERALRGLLLVLFAMHTRQDIRSMLDLAALHAAQRSR